MNANLSLELHFWLTQLCTNIPRISQLQDLKTSGDGLIQVSSTVSLNMEMSKWYIFAQSEKASGNLNSDVLPFTPSATTWGQKKIIAIRKPSFQLRGDDCFLRNLLKSLEIKISHIKWIHLYLQWHACAANVIGVLLHPAGAIFRRMCASNLTA